MNGLKNCDCRFAQLPEGARLVETDKDGKKSVSREARKLFETEDCIQDYEGNILFGPKDSDAILARSEISEFWGCFEQQTHIPKVVEATTDGLVLISISVAPTPARTKELMDAAKEYVMAYLR